MPIVAINGSENISNTEHSLPADAAYDADEPQTDDGIFQLFLDLRNLVAGDAFRLRVYTKVNGQTAKPILDVLLTGVFDEHYVTPAFVFTEPWDMTLVRESASSRVIDWTLNRVS